METPEIKNRPTRKNEKQENIQTLEAQKQKIIQGEMEGDSLKDLKEEKEKKQTLLEQEKDIVKMALQVLRKKSSESIDWESDETFFSLKESLFKDGDAVYVDNKWENGVDLGMMNTILFKSDFLEQSKISPEYASQILEKHEAVLKGILSGEYNTQDEVDYWSMQLRKTSVYKELQKRKKALRVVENKIKKSTG